MDKTKSAINSESDYKIIYNRSVKEPDQYWLEITKNYTWVKEPSKGLSGSFKKPVDIRWFEDGVLNITENALDRHIKTQPHKTALIFEPNDPDSEAISFTYKEVFERVCQISKALDDQGLKKGDGVCFYMSMIPELVFSLLACARLGLTHSVVFGGFSAQALKDRIEDFNPKAIITNDFGRRGAKTIPIKEVVDEALSGSSANPQVFVWSHTKEQINMGEKDTWFNEILNSDIKDFPAVPVEAEHPLFILYTSGSTGKPKGLVHSTAGYMVWSSETFKNVFQVKDKNDVFWCTADVGWITGHSYLTYSPFVNGITQVMFEGVPTWPDPGRFWSVVDKHRVTHFYTAPTAIRALQACDIGFVKKHELNTLKVLGTVGEPINEEAWQWYKEHIGSGVCPIVDTWWQTETGGIMLSNLAGITPERPTWATQPLPGVQPCLLTPEGKEITEANESGELCIRHPWPGVARTVFGDHKRFEDTYFSQHPGYYFTGDGAKKDELNSFRISGRIDDVVNVSGHRIGTAELEDVIDEVSGVIEAAVVGAPHNVKGQCLIAFVVGDKEQKTYKDSKELTEALNERLTKDLGPFYKLEKAIEVPDLPKTRSGKIMRRILRKIGSGENNFGDTSTLINPEVVSKIQESFLA
jgi:acetyl-CoA synthetase